jgi:DsbC/DsbD-like thiol-disulfide interchange protein
MGLVLLAPAVGPAATAAPAAAPYIQADLIASTKAPRPGSTILVGFRMDPQPGWHGYWSNPGGSGIAPTVHWTAPPGVHFGPLLHPAPTLFQSLGVASYVHGGPHVLISRMSIDGTIVAGASLPVSADLNWAACSNNLCVPQHATLSLRMVAGKGEPSAEAGILNRALAKVPGPVGSGTFSVSNGKLVLQLPADVGLNPTAVRFFPDRNGVYDPARAHSVGGRPIRLVAPLQGSPPDALTGVVTDRSSAYRLTLRRSPAAAAAPPRPLETASTAAAAQLPDSPAAALARSSHELPSPSPSPSPSSSSSSSSLSPLIRALALLGIIGFGVLVIALARRPYR